MEPGSETLAISAIVFERRELSKDAAFLLLALFFYGARGPSISLNLVPDKLNRLMLFVNNILILVIKLASLYSNATRNTLE